MKRKYEKPMATTVAMEATSMMVSVSNSSSDGGGGLYVRSMPDAEDEEDW